MASGDEIAGRLVADRPRFLDCRCFTPPRPAVVTVFARGKTYCLCDGVLHWGCGYNCGWKGCQRKLWEETMGRSRYVYILRDARGRNNIQLSWDEPLTRGQKENLTIEWPIGWDYKLPDSLDKMSLDKLLIMYEKAKGAGTLPTHPQRKSEATP
jgi:hypothetical protein